MNMQAASSGIARFLKIRQELRAVPFFFPNDSARHNLFLPNF